MVFELGDHVRILRSGQTGFVCDVHFHEDRYIYIVELEDVELSEDDSLWDILETVEHHEIERI